MKAPFYFIIKPYKSRYDNTVEVGNKTLITNTSIEDHLSVSKMAVVVAVPFMLDTDIKVGDVVMVHHNIFRRYYDIRGNEKNSRDYFRDDLYFADDAQIYAYHDGYGWSANFSYCFVAPLVNTGQFKETKEKERIGILKYGNKLTEELKITPGDVIGYKPYREFEFIIEGERLYCMKSNDIVVKYGREGNEIAYNPKCAESRGRVN